MAPHDADPPPGPPDTGGDSEVPTPDPRAAQSPDSEVLRALHIQRGPVRWPWIVGLLAAVAVTVAAVVGARRPEDTGRWAYETVDAMKGDLTVRVTAVGQVQPVNAVQISSELSGVVRSVDVELDQSVNRGEVLARLDATLLRSQDRQAAAAVVAAGAALNQVKVSGGAAAREFERSSHVARGGGLAIATLDQAESAAKGAAAAVALAEAQLSQAKAAAAAARAQLSKATLRSPIDGVVLERNVEPGQAVVSALQAQTLFVVAETLRRMEVEVDIDEADIGRLAPGQQAEFTVPAHPERVFPAVVRKVHLAPKPGLGVVTYRAVLDAPNPDGALLPGMTATARIDTATLTDVMLVPNGALRWAPEDGDPQPAPTPVDGRRVARAWRRVDGEPVSVDVQPGASDGRFTVVDPGAVTDGTELIVNATDRRRANP